MAATRDTHPSGKAWVQLKSMKGGTDGKEAALTWFDVSGEACVRGPTGPLQTSRQVRGSCA